VRPRSLPPLPPLSTARSRNLTSRRKIHGHHDFLGVGALSAAEEAELIAAEQAPQHETSFIILSDLHLDNAKVLAALRDVLGAYNDMEPRSIPRLFVLCGNFRSRPWLFDGEAMREYSGAWLLSLLSRRSRAQSCLSYRRNGGTARY